MGLDSGLKKMLKSLGYSTVEFRRIIREIGIYDDIYDLKAKRSSEVGVLWNISKKDNKDFIQILDDGNLKINSKGYRNEMISGRIDTLTVESETVYDLDIYIYISYVNKRFENIIVRGNRFGELRLNLEVNPNFFFTLNFENDNKKIVFDCGRININLSCFMNSFLKLFNYSNISIIDIIKSLLFNTFSLCDVVKFNIFDKVTNSDENYLIIDDGKKFIMADGRIITMEKAYTCDDYRIFSCKNGDFEVRVLLNKIGGKINDNALTKCVEFKMDVVYDILEYFNSLEFPVFVEDVYNKFLVFSKKFEDLSFMTISIFNKNTGLIVEIHNGECMALCRVTDRYVSEWHKDGSFEYKKKDNGAIVLIDKDANTVYNGPVNYTSIDSKVINPNEFISYRTVMEAQDGLDEIRNLSNDMRARLHVR